MTIKERFAKYTTEEIIKGMEKLNARAEEHREMMDTFKQRKDLEMFKQTESLYEDDIKHLMDAQLALTYRWLTQMSASVTALSPERL